MTLEIIGGIFSVCKLEKLPSALPDTNFIFFARTDSEISLVCPTDFVPAAFCTAQTAGALCAFAASWTFRSSASSPISHPCSRGGG